jgi:PIN domain nuclease of toxin-antitoxin system
MTLPPDTQVSAGLLEGDIVDDPESDPFDRILLAQAEVEPLRLVTNGALLAKYGKNVIAV